jgi:uncharacterized YigZ family protein
MSRILARRLHNVNVASSLSESLVAGKLLTNGCPFVYLETGVYNRSTTLRATRSAKPRLKAMNQPQRYTIPAQQHRTEEEIKRSRFITTLGHTPSVEAAREFISLVHQEFADANHNCWAYVAGPPGSSAYVGMSDDGEPHGTAGRPMLTVLLHSDVGEITAVVTRYFGGTLLGKGGLVRAYSGGVKSALESLPVIERIPLATALVMVDYAMLTPMHNMLADYEAEIIGEDFAVDVTLRIRLPEERYRDFENAIVNLTNANAVVERIE